MNFEEALATQADWIQFWVMWMGIALVGSVVILLFSRSTWKDAAILVGVNAVMFVAMQALYAQVGYVRLLGLPHVVFWTPLVAYLIWRLKTHPIPTPFREVIMVLVATMLISLAFDYTDVIRYLLGEHKSLIVSSDVTS